MVMGRVEKKQNELEKNEIKEHVVLSLSGLPKPKQKREIPI